MPRRIQPPRLFLRRAKGKRARWVILDNGREHGTGAGEGERGKAAAALAQYIRGQQRTTGPRDPAAVSIADVLIDYQEGHADETRDPKMIIRANIRLAEFFADRTCDAITPELCVEYVKWRTQQKDGRYGHRLCDDDDNIRLRNGGRDGHSTRAVSSSTARRELATLNAALHWAYRHRRLTHPIPVELPPVSEPRDRYLTRDEVARLLRAARQLGHRHLCRFILLGVYTGTRHHAILELQWMRNTEGGWVDLEAGVLYRRAEGAVESSKRRRPVPIPPRLLPHLRGWQRGGGRFLIEQDGRRVAIMRRPWHAARQLAGLDEGVIPHALKHTCATWLLQSGASMQDVAGILGTTEAVISHTYGHHAQTHLRRVLGAFSRRG